MTATHSDIAPDQAQALERGFEGFEVRRAVHDGVGIGYRLRGQGPAVLFVHGYPQSGYEWHAVAADLANDHLVIVPDYRGAAGSDKPAGGYDKATMAADLYAVLLDADAESAHVVGHDIGLMVAYAFARAYPGATRTLSLIDGIVPGTSMFTAMMSSLGPWHFGFHSQVDLATAVVRDHERVYFDWLFDNHMTNPAAITEADRDFYVEAARAPGALAAGFRTYEAATTVDSLANEKTLAADGQLSMPVLGIGGAMSLGAYQDAILGEVAFDLRTILIEDAGHFLAEEKPQEVSTALRSFIAEHA